MKPRTISNFALSSYNRFVLREMLRLFGKQVFVVEPYRDLGMEKGFRFILLIFPLLNLFKVQMTLKKLISPAAGGRSEYLLTKNF